VWRVEEVTMSSTMECGGMMWGMGIVGLLGVTALALLIAALIKYLFSSQRNA
jgi:hypothetical protein